MQLLLSIYIYGYQWLLVSISGYQWLLRGLLAMAIKAKIMSHMYLIVSHMSHNPSHMSHNPSHMSHNPSHKCVSQQRLTRNKMLINVKHASIFIRYK